MNRNREESKKCLQAFENEKRRKKRKMKILHVKIQPYAVCAVCTGKRDTTHTKLQYKRKNPYK